MNNEDIKVLEKYMKEQKEFAKQFNFEEIEDGTEGQRRLQAIENLIKGYKDLQEENKILDEQINAVNKKNNELEEKRKTTMEVVGANYIHKDKVREKIEELEKQMEKDEVDDFGIHSIGWSALDYIVDYLKSILQEGDK